MHEEKPSATAWRVAVARAAHQQLDRPKVFDDPLALRIVGAGADGQSSETFFSEAYRRSIRAKFLRAVLVVRSRIAEEELAGAAVRGVRQYVLLGAGLDTFAYRNPHPAIRVFEVDHPATQAWKRTLLARAAISEPESLTFVPVDFERQTVMNELLAAGFDRTVPALFAWLGVTMYLSEAAVYSVLEAIAGLPPPTGVVFDYAVAGSELNLVTRMVVAIVNRRLTRAGEPWVTFFTPRALAATLTTLGFHRVRDWGPEELNATYFSGRTDGLQVSAAARVVAASV